MSAVMALLLLAPTALRIAITGTNSGIGKAAASLLLKDGHTVYHACRTAEGAQQAVEAAGGGGISQARRAASARSVQMHCIRWGAHAHPPSIDRTRGR